MGNVKDGLYVTGKFTMKALQSSSQPDTLTWNSVGDTVNFNTDESYVLDTWIRKGIFLCSAEQFNNTPNQAGYFLTDYDGYFDIPSSGNKLFKAIMVKIEYEMTLPAHTEVHMDQIYGLPVHKSSDSSSSSTYVGSVLSGRNSCKTIGKNNCSSEWSGIPQEEIQFIYQSNDAYYDQYGIPFKKIAVEDSNQSNNEVYKGTVPMYQFCMVEQPKSYPTYLGVTDNCPVDGYSALSSFTSHIVFDGEKELLYKYKEQYGLILEEGIYLLGNPREGYILQGWLDAETGVLYPEKGFFNERRGVNLIGQYVPNTAKYTVRHYYPFLKGLELGIKEEVFYNMVGAQVTPRTLDEPIYAQPKPITATVAADGSTLIEYYYRYAQYAVQYSANGGTFGDNNDIIEEMVTFNDSIPKMKSEVSRRGYLFKGWGELPDYMPCHSLLTCAMWTPYQYNVCFTTKPAGNQRPMDWQEFYYDEAQKLSKNVYTCKYTVNFEIATETGDKFCFEQEVSCSFIGWAREWDGEKAYNDEEVVYNLTDKQSDKVTLYALWEAAKIRLPQITYNGYYLDGWYTDEDYNNPALAGPGDEYTPNGDITLYARLINTNPVVPDIMAENLRWEQEGEFVEKRTIKAAWDAAEGAASYLVGLQLLVGSGDEVEKQDMSLTKEDFPEGVEVTDSGVAEVTGCELDFTETFKRFPEGGNYIFTVTPVMPEGAQGNIEMSESSVVTTLRCIQKEEMGWDDSRMIAEWSAVEGADYYLVWIYIGDNSLSELGDSIENYATLQPFMHDENSILIRSTEADLSELIDAFGSIGYRVLGYSEDKSQHYTPLYDEIISDSNA